MPTGKTDQNSLIKKKKNFLTLKISFCCSKIFVLLAKVEHPTNNSIKTFLILKIIFGSSKIFVLQAKGEHKAANNLRTAGSFTV